MIFYLFVLVVGALAIAAVADDMVNGSILGFRDDQVGELVEFPLVEGWTERDVLTTYAEIQAL